MHLHEWWLWNANLYPKLPLVLNHMLFYVIMPCIWVAFFSPYKGVNSCNLHDLVAGLLSGSSVLKNPEQYAWRILVWQKQSRDCHYGNSGKMDALAFLCSQGFKPHFPYLHTLWCVFVGSEAGEIQELWASEAGYQMASLPAISSAHCLYFEDTLPSHSSLLHTSFSCLASSSSNAVSQRREWLPLCCHRCR